MKKLLPILIITLAINVNAQKGSLAGQIIDFTKSEPIPYSTIKISSSNEYMSANKDGKFKIDSLPVGKYEIEIIYVGHIPKKISGNIVKDSIVFVRVELSDFCIYENIYNKRCPVCYSKGRVIPIVYGFPVGEMDTVNYRYAGCEITDCDPNWYCKRDKIEF